MTLDSPETRHPGFERRPVLQTQPYFCKGPEHRTHPAQGQHGQHHPLGKTLFPRVVPHHPQRRPGQLCRVSGPASHGNAWGRKPATGHLLPQRAWRTATQGAVDGSSGARDYPDRSQRHLIHTHRTQKAAQKLQLFVGRVIGSISGHFPPLSGGWFPWPPGCS